MERCSLCGTPLRQNDTTCSHCQHPVIKKEQPADPPAPSSSRTWLISTFLFLLLVGGAISSGIRYKIRFHLKPRSDTKRRSTRPFRMVG
ncbi:hypothetical protein OVA29_03525 [Exiguobacterium sp. SL14]|nr:hypothetical protein [Exiguobacterium sp. SL14]MCY1690001.1 hypothetical protein [Exiguobacterium sp. SL14]